jgi:glyoxylase-like metal-dependent hydrolase (beta-lactamase superfamily II)
MLRLSAQSNRMARTTTRRNFVRSAGVLASGILSIAATSAFAASFSRPTAKNAPDLFTWTDTCNVYVLRDGDAALLINLGDGSVLGHLSEVGVKRVEWVLFTDHHREQCQGASRLGPWRERGTRVAAPEAERALFERPLEFRKMNVSLGDAFTIHGASFVRPPIQPILLDRTFATNDAFVWRGREFRCMDTRGASPGGLTYRLQENGQTFAFSGDVILDGGKMHAWLDTEWDYGFAAGIQALRKSVARLTDSDIAWLLPSHGPAMREPKAQWQTFAARLERLETLYLRGYDPEHGSVAYQDKVSKPTVVSNVWQVSPHLFKFKRPNFWPNFSLILSDNGRALLSDCGLLDEKFLDEALEGMRQHFGLKAIDAIVVSHMHGDHFLEAPHLREKWGAQIWALDNMVDKMEHPERFDYAAPIQAYGKKSAAGSRITGVRVDRAFKSGESFEWEGKKFTIDWMPGQTEFALCLHGEIDGRKVAFTGDNIFGDPDNPTQTGHEAMVAHNSAILEEGYIYGAEYLKRLKPDLLMGGHSFVMNHPAKFIERYRKWGYEMRDAFQALSSERDYRYWFDPFWVRAEPYRAIVDPGHATNVTLHVRNFRSGRQRHRIEIHTPPGLRADPAVLEGTLAAESRQSFPIRLQASADAGPGVRLVAFDVTLDGRRYGERFDMIVNVDPGTNGHRSKP